jgi:hypothetical protein
MITESNRGRYLAAILTTIVALATGAAYADGLSGTHRYVEVRGAKLYTQIYGNGPAIVLATASSYLP